MKICKICGELKENHHNAVYITVPDNCVCPIGEWDTSLKKIPPVCKNYDGDGRECQNCEHNKECHK